MEDADLVRHLYSYNPDTGEWRWRNPPPRTAFAKATPGSLAGTPEKRDGSLWLRFNRKIHRAGRLAWLYVHGEWPENQILYRDPNLPLPERDRFANLKLADTVEEPTQVIVRSLLRYDEASGEFYWRVSRKGVKAGAQAALLKNTSAKSAYRYIRLDGVDYPAQRIAWMYVHGRWPTSRIAFKDNDPKNCALNNLYESGFEHGTRQTPEISEGERRERQRASYRRHDLKRTFKITAAQYQAIHDAQHGLCPVCKSKEKSKRNGRVKWLGVDHNHDTDQLRDLLCQNCNFLIGHSRESPEILRTAARYLELHLFIAGLVRDVEYGSEEWLKIRESAETLMTKGKV